MKTKIANRPNWSRILEKEYKQIYLNDDSYRGHITYLNMRKVRKPLYVNYSSEDICIIDDGYTWMMHFPDDSNYSVTTAFDANGKVVQWYFDIIKNQGLTSEGIPYIEDLYLDVVFLPNGNLHILDEDELDEALKSNEITKEDFDMAKVTLTNLIESIDNNLNKEITEYKRYFALKNLL